MALTYFKSALVYCLSSLLVIEYPRYKMVIVVMRVGARVVFFFIFATLFIKYCKTSMVFLLFAYLILLLSVDSFRLGSVDGALKRTIVFSTIKPHSSDVACVLPIFSPGCLRYHDNPCLNYVQDNFKQSSCSVVPVVWPKECVSDDIKSSLANKLFDKHANKLLACAEKEFEELIRALPYNKITVVCMETTAEPMKSQMCRWLLSASVPNKTISFKKVNDNMLCESISSSKTEKLLSEPKTWEDLNFRNYAPIYRRVPPPAPRMTYASDIPFASSYPHELDKYLLHGSNEENALQGEDKGIEYIRDYIDRGETAFSQDLSNLEAYIEAVGDSEEHKRSLRRLSPLLHSSSPSSTTTSPLPSSREHFFTHEILSGVLAPYISTGQLSLRLLYHARQVLGGLDGGQGALEQSLRRAFVQRPLSCPLRQEAVRRDWHLFVSRFTHLSQKWRVSFSYYRHYLQRTAEYIPPSQRGPRETALPPSPVHLDPRPSLVLVHGFGGSIEQFTPLADHLMGDAASSPFARILALDSIGFSLSEKPPLSYNQYLWRDQVVSFMRLTAEECSSAYSSDVHRFVVGGNSIGGYCASSTAAHLSLYPTIPPQSASSSPSSSAPAVQVSGVVLFNPSGLILPPSQRTPLTYQRSSNDLFPEYRGPPQGLLRVFGEGLFALLQGNIQRTCQWLYPTAPPPDNLAGRIFRDSCDPNAPILLSAGGKLPPPESMDLLLGAEFTGPVLLVQGVLDPLNNATMRAEMFRQIERPLPLDVALLQLGHCPMDENGVMVGDVIKKWMAEKSQ